MKRNCNECRALDRTSFNLAHCELNYKIAPLTKNQLGTIYKPLEECPKPKTIDHFIKCLNEKSTSIQLNKN